VGNGGGSGYERFFMAQAPVQPQYMHMAQGAIYLCMDRWPDRQHFINVAAGTYIVTVTDHNSCSVTASVTISQPSAALLLQLLRFASCFGGSNGQVSTSVTGGTNTYSYVWNTAPANNINRQ